MVVLVNPSKKLLFPAVREERIPSSLQLLKYLPTCLLINNSPHSPFPPPSTKIEISGTRQGDGRNTAPYKHPPPLSAISKRMGGGGRRRKGGKRKKHSTSQHTTPSRNIEAEIIIAHAGLGGKGRLPFRLPIAGVRFSEGWGVVGRSERVNFQAVILQDWRGRLNAINLFNITILCLFDVVRQLRRLPVSRDLQDPVASCGDGWCSTGSKSKLANAASSWLHYRSRPSLQYSTCMGRRRMF